MLVSRPESKRYRKGRRCGRSAKTVTILTHDSFALDQADIAAFEKESGYQLKTISAGDGTVINQLRLKKDAPVVDGFYGIDNFTVSEVIKEDLAAKLETPVEPASLMVDGKLVAIDQGDVCLNVDKTWFAQKGIAAPASFDDLLKPEYKDLTVLTDPVASTPRLAFFVGTIAKYGENGWKEYWQKLLANGVKISAGWSDAYYTDFSGSEGKGPYPIVLSYASSPAESKGATASVDNTCVEQLEYAGVVKNAENPEGARAFIDFLLSEKVQASLPTQMYVYPVKADVSLPEDWAKYAKRAANPIKVDAQKVAKNRETWLNEFTALYQAAGK
ncbi:thiamine ABC transporter substrate-binding protein [Arcanobacterium hippocoleae]